MNNYVNNETDLLCYRLRTPRQRKRAAREEFEKKLIRLYKEERALYKQKRELGWIELKPPVMRGWKRFFVLRDDLARGKQASFFQAILDRINKIEYSSRKDFKKKKRQFGKKIYVEKDQQLLEPSERHFGKLNFSDREKQFFNGKYIWHKGNRKPEKVFVFVEPWRFVLRVRPNIITKTRIKDEGIENRLGDIDDYFAHNHLRPKLWRLIDGNYQYRWKEYDDREVYEFKNVPLQQILDSVREY